MPHDWLKKLAPHFHPIRSKTKTNRDSLARVFPRFASATCNYYEFWLAHSNVYGFGDWLEWLLWFWFYDAQLKTALAYIQGLPRFTHLPRRHVLTVVKLRNSDSLFYSLQKSLLTDQFSTRKEDQFIFSSKSISTKCFAQFYTKIIFWKNFVSTKKTLLRFYLFFINNKIITSQLIGSEFCCVSFVDSGWVKLKSNFNQLCFTKKTKRANPLTLINEELIFHWINPVSTSTK